MNINYKAENKQLNLEKRNKQNSGIPKPVLYTGLSIAGVATISIIGKIFYDKLTKNDNNNPGSQQDKEKTTEINIQENLRGGPADNYNPNVKITDKNYLMAFKQNDSYCFHNALLQLLACPEIRCKKHGLNNIDKMIGWINSIINENYDTMSIANGLSTPIAVPEDIRLQPEVQFNNPLTGEKIDLTDAPMFDLKSRNVVKQGALSSSKGNAVCFDINAIAISLQDKGKDSSFINLIDNYNSEYNARLLDLGFVKVCSSVWLQGEGDVFKLAQSYPEIVENKIENFVACINGMGEYNGKRPGPFIIEKCKEMGYYPTFGTALMGDHYYHFYLIYDEQQNMKKILWNGGNGFSLLPADEFYKQFEMGTVYVKFSNKDIVKKYYTEFN